MAKIRKQRKKTTDNLPIGIRIPTSMAAELAKFGPHGTAAGDIVKKFFAVKKFFPDGYENRQITSIKDNSVIYTTDIGPDLFHLTIKKGDVILIAELNKQEMAACAVLFAETLNKQYPNQG